MRCIAESDLSCLVPTLEANNHSLPLSVIPLRCSFLSTSFFALILLYLHCFHLQLSGSPNTSFFSSWI
jgi:hypothetical protein